MAKCPYGELPLWRRPLRRNVLRRNMLRRSVLLQKLLEPANTCEYIYTSKTWLLNSFIVLSHLVWFYWMNSIKQRFQVSLVKILQPICFLFRSEYAALVYLHWVYSIHSAHTHQYNGCVVVVPHPHVDWAHHVVTWQNLSAPNYFLLLAFQKRLNLFFVRVYFF